MHLRGRAVGHLESLHVSAQPSHLRWEAAFRRLRSALLCAGYGYISSDGDYNGVTASLAKCIYIIKHVN